MMRIHGEEVGKGRGGDDVPMHGLPLSGSCSFGRVGRTRCPGRTWPIPRAVI